MIIFLDESISSHVDSLTSEEWIAIENLATASREGKHRVCIGRKLASILGERTSQLKLATSTFYSRRASNATTEFDKHIKDSPVYIKVLKESQHTRIESNNQIIFQVPLVYFSDTSKIQKFALVCENLNDCHLFLKLAMQFSSFCRLNSYTIGFEKFPGGGSSTSELLTEKLDSCLFTLAIVDSDKDYPDAPLGSTAKRVKVVYDQHLNNKFADLIILDCREIENLLPDDLLAELPNLINDKTCDIIRLMSENDCWLRLYSDIKGGVKFNDLLRLKEKLGRSDWDSLQPIIQAARKGQPIQCFDNATCNAQSMCSCIIMQGLGQNMVKEITKLNFGKFHNLWDTKCTRHSNELHRVLSKLLFWGIADQRLIT